MTATRLSIDFLGDGGAAKEYNVLVIGEATESDADLGDDEQKEEDDVAMKEDDELIASEVAKYDVLVDGGAAKEYSQSSNLLNT